MGAGEQPCYDRLVLDLGSGAPAGYSVAYVDQVRQDGTGAVIPTWGGARLQVVAHAPACSASGRPTYLPRHPTEVLPVSGPGHAVPRRAPAPRSVARGVERGTRLRRRAVAFAVAGGARPGWQVQYVDRAVHDGSGAVLPLPGSAVLQVVDVRTR